MALRSQYEGTRARSQYRNYHEEEKEHRLFQQENVIVSPTSSQLKDRYKTIQASSVPFTNLDTGQSCTRVTVDVTSGWPRGVLEQNRDSDYILIYGITVRLYATQSSTPASGIFNVVIDRGGGAMSTEFCKSGFALDPVEDYNGYETIFNRNISVAGGTIRPTMNTELLFDYPIKVQYQSGSPNPIKGNIYFNMSSTNLTEPWQLIGHTKLHYQNL